MIILSLGPILFRFNFDAIQDIVGVWHLIKHDISPTYLYICITELIVAPEISIGNLDKMASVYLKHAAIPAHFYAT